MITFKQLLEQKKSTVVMTFGRMNPVTVGHSLLVERVLEEAKRRNADHVIYLSKSQDSKKNPLNVDQKVYYARQSFPGANIKGADDKIRTFIEVAKSLTGKYSNLVMIAGSDRVPEYKRLLDQYNGKDFTFDSIEVVSAGERDPDADGAAGMSATKMRQAAVANDFAKFKQGVPPKMSQTVARKMFDDVRSGLKINETFDETRDDYVNERILGIGDIVIHEDKESTVTFRGSNYVVLDEQKRVWISDVTPTDKINEAIMVKQQDKLKAARIIGLSLGYADAESKTDPSMIVNNALRGMRNKSLNKESLSIIHRMLMLAKQMEIKFDESLFGIKEFFDAADYKIGKDGRKIRAHRIVTAKIDDEQQNESANVDAEEKQAHNLMTKPGVAQQSEYERRRKIHLKMHENEDEEDFDEDDIEISDDDIIEHGYDDEEFNIVDDENNIVESIEASDSELNEVLSRVERLKAKVRMRRSEAKRERGMKIALKRRSNTATLAKRARRVAVNTLKAKLARKPIDQLSVAEKERIEKRLERMGPVITRIAAKMLPRVRQVEKTRLEHSTTEK